MSAPSTQNAFVPVFEYFPEDDEELLIKLSSLHTIIASSINSREIAFYQDGTQVITGQQFSSGGSQKQGFRKTFYFGAINAGATLNIAHGLSGVSAFTRIYGTVATASDSRPLPYVDATDVTKGTSVLVGSTNISIVNGAAATAITSGIVVLEYLYT